VTQIKGRNHEKADRRAIVIVLDGLGIGALPDAKEYGDEGTQTLGHICEKVTDLRLPNLAAMGLGHLGAFSGIPPVPFPTGCFGRMAEQSVGKDTTVGHWELMGWITDFPFPTYPQGFPPEIMRLFEQSIGRKTLGNLPASGTEIIQRLGDEHVRTGFPIVYTSADSVFQVAAHEEILSPSELYEICRCARKILSPPHGVARVIARPFIGKSGHYTRTDRRHDFSLPPPGKTLLNLLSEQDFDVVGVGKIKDIFAGSGLTRSLTTGSNREGINRILEAMEEVASGLILANLVEFDMLYGHRNDPEGYAEGLREFDLRLPEILRRMRSRDLLVITADHGCDPTTPGTDHTREYVPLLLFGSEITHGVPLGTKNSMADLAKTLQDLFKIPGDLQGRGFRQRVSPDRKHRTNR
jgi:phosphopentomutase